MTRGMIDRLFVVAGLALLLLAGVVLSLRTANVSMSVDMLHSHVLALQATPTLTETTATPTLTPTGASTSTNATLTGTLVAETATATLESLPPLVLTPTTPSPTETPTETPTPTGTPTPIPTSSATPTPAPSATAPVEPTSPPLPTTAVTAEPSPVLPFPLPPPLGDFVNEAEWYQVAAMVAVPVLLFIAIILILIGLLRRRPKPPPPLPSQTAGGAYLEGVDVDGEPRRFGLNPGGTTIGRGPKSDLTITKQLPGWDTVSRNHARVYRQAGSWFIKDLGSTNGVWVNGKRTGHNLLQDGSRLGLGGVDFVFHAGPEEAER